MILLLNAERRDAGCVHTVAKRAQHLRQPEE